MTNGTRSVESATKWDAHFIRLAHENCSMSKDPRTQVGAVLVGPNGEPRSDGFNGFPRGIADDHRLLDREIKNLLTVHAEMNAILNAARTGVSTVGCSLYLAATDDTGEVWGGAPCTQCSIHVIQAGIVEVVSLPFKNGPSAWRADTDFAAGLLREAGIVHRVISDWQR